MDPLHTRIRAQELTLEQAVDKILDQEKALALILDVLFSPGSPTRYSYEDGTLAPGTMAKIDELIAYRTTLNWPV